MTSFITRIFAVTTISALALPAIAERDLAVGGGIGTTGGHVQLQYRLSDNIQFRGEANYLKFEDDFTVSGIDFDAEPDFSGVGAFVDYHPFGNAWFISAGAYLGTSKIDLEHTSDQTFMFRGMALSRIHYGDITGKTEFNDIAPFVGFGWDSTFANDGHWGFEALLGATWYGSGDVSLQSSGGMYSDDPMVQMELASLRDDISEEIEDYEIYPVARIGITYRF